MLENRDYMRAPSFEPHRPVTIILLIVNVVAFVLQNVAAYYFRSVPVEPYLALSLAGLQHWYLWQLLTFQFLHGGLLHLLLNCWGLYVFGRALEETLGRRNFLVLYFGSGMCGGLVQMLAALAWPGHWGGAVVGASAGLFGLVAAYAMLFPERQLTLLLFLILPVTMRAKFLLLFSAGLAVFGLVFPDGQVAHAAHLGGMLAGMVYIQQGLHVTWRWPSALRAPPRRLHPRETVSAGRSREDIWLRRPAGRVEEMPAEEFIRKEVDPILDKISAHGIHSLTERERKILETARQRMSKP